MRFMRYLINNGNLLNVLLLAMAVVAFVAVGLSLTKMNSTYTPPKAKPKAETVVVPKEEKTAGLMPTDYAVIGEMNLFHPERRIIFEKKAEEVVRPDLILYGTMIQDAVQYAFIENRRNPSNSPGRGVRQTVVKKGDDIGGFVISEVAADRIVLVRGDDRMVVLLADAARKRNGSGTPSVSSPSPPSPVGQSGAVNPFTAQGSIRQQRQSGMPNVTPAPPGTQSPAPQSFPRQPMTTGPQPLPRQSITPGQRPVAP